MELKEATEKIDAQEYSKLLKRIEIKDCYLKRLQSFCSSRKIGGRAAFNFNEDVGQFSVVEESASVEVKYSLEVNSDDLNVLQLNADFVLAYSVEGELPEAFFVIFRSYTVPLQSFPYIRELAHSLTSRMGLPPLILPLRKNFSEVQPGDKEVDKEG